MAGDKFTVVSKATVAPASNRVFISVTPLMSSVTSVQALRLRMIRPMAASPRAEGQEIDRHDALRESGEATLDTKTS
jgi:hypothetical protein